MDIALPGCFNQPVCAGSDPAEYPASPGDPTCFPAVGTEPTTAAPSPGGGKGGGGGDIVPCEAPYPEYIFKFDETDETEPKDGRTVGRGSSPCNLALERCDSYACCRGFCWWCCCW